MEWRLLVLINLVILLLLNIVFNISKQFFLVDFRSLAVILLEVVAFLGVCWILWVLFNRGSRGSRVIVPPVPTWVQNLFSWVFNWSVIFCRGYFVCANFFLMGVLWVQYFFLWVFRGSKFFSGGYFVGPNHFSLWMFLDSIIFSWLFRGSKNVSYECVVGNSWMYKWEIRTNKFLYKQILT